jgi:hypothetical protein
MNFRGWVNPTLKTGDKGIVEAPEEETRLDILLPGTVRAEKHKRPIS